MSYIGLDFIPECETVVLMKIYLHEDILEQYL